MNHLIVRDSADHMMLRAKVTFETCHLSLKRPLRLHKLPKKKKGQSYFSRRASNKYGQFEFLQQSHDKYPKSKASLSWIRGSMTITLQLSHASAGISFSLLFSPASNRMAASRCTLINWGWCRLMCFQRCSTVTEHNEGELMATGPKSKEAQCIIYFSPRFTL